MGTNYITGHRPTDKKRLRSCTNGRENHLTEAAVMVAFAMHLLNEGANKIEVHPDGEHGKRFDIRKCLEAQGFVLSEPRGTTGYGGLYRRDTEALTITPKSGEGDVVAAIGGKRLLAECKGGMTNSNHAGHTSRLRKGLCEVVGLLMARSLTREKERHVAVVPATEVTKKLARQMQGRATSAGIEFAFVREDGGVEFLDASSNASKP